LHRWDNGVLAGRDRAAGGTWMGVHADGRFAGLTNVRQGFEPSGARSRGELPLRFLDAADPAAGAAARIAADLDGYGGFNLLLADDREMWWLTNRNSVAPQRVSPGIHGVSNAALDTAWPKVAIGKDRFAAALSADDGSDAAAKRYVDLLADTQRAPWRSLPRTGVPRIAERRLSAAFVDMGDYGTRASTVLRIRNDGSFDITEHRFGPAGRPLGTTALTS
ncbi:MAG: NRDE family protein, partial [Streptomycetaceae bacterium]|nr:NRDE family protein [Streptomycetaceae bacterium]